MPRPSNRERLLDCAEELLVSRDVGTVSMREIQSAAGLSVGSLRYHFKSESELIAAVMERRLEFHFDLAWETLLGSMARGATLSPGETPGAIRKT